MNVQHERFHKVPLVWILQVIYILATILLSPTEWECPVPWHSFTAMSIRPIPCRSPLCQWLEKQMRDRCGSRTTTTIHSLMQKVTKCGNRFLWHSQEPWRPNVAVAPLQASPCTDTNPCPYRELCCTLLARATHTQPTTSCRSGCIPPSNTSWCTPPRNLLLPGTNNCTHRLARPRRNQVREINWRCSDPNPSN